MLCNHDVVRHVTRYGGGEQGLARARAATLAMLALPGASYLYQGEELGLEQVDVAPEDRQDPSWFRTGEVGRDGCRVPIPWGGDRPPFEFGPGDAQPWIPQPDEFEGLTVEAQTGVEGSTLEFYRAALAARRAHALPAGDDVDRCRGRPATCWSCTAATCGWCSTAAPPPSRCPRAGCSRAAARSPTCCRPTPASGSAEPHRTPDGPPLDR